MRTIEPIQEWKIITTEPERMRSGLWGYAEGDIAASYSADTYGLERKLRRAFQHAHQPYVAMSIQSRSLFDGEAKAYPILHSSYADDIIAEYQATELSDYYTGKAVQFYRQDCIFGLPVIFKQRALNKAEIIDQCRRAFAYGGLFASEAGNYKILLLEWQAKDHSHRIKQALSEELANESLPQGQHAMREFIEASLIKAPEEQLCLL